MKVVAIFTLIAACLTLASSQDLSSAQCLANEGSTVAQCLTNFASIGVHLYYSTYANSIAKLS